MAQLSQKNWKTSFLNEDQKVELVIRLFSDYFDCTIHQGLKMSQKTYVKRMNDQHLSDAYISFCCTLIGQ